MGSIEQGAAPANPEGHGGGCDQPQFSLLGQQRKAYDSSQHQQLLHPPSSTLGFGLGSHPPESNHADPLARQEGQSDGGQAFHGLVQPFPFGLGQEYGSHFNVQANTWGSSMLAAGKAESQMFMTALLIVQQKISHLQTLVQLIAHGGHSNAALKHQQMATAVAVASCISQLVIAASGMIPEQSYHPSQFMNCAQIAQLCSTHPFSPGLNSLQQNAFASTLAATCGNPLFPNNFMPCLPKESGSFGTSFAVDSLSDPNVQLFGSQNVLAQATDTPKSSLETSSGNLVAEVAGTGRSAGIGGFNGINGESTSEKVGNNHMACGAAEMSMNVEDHDAAGAVGCKDEEEDYTELLSPGSYELLELDAMEILAEHTHFCDICGKGFKRDANLRMHMRGHGDEFKTVAALARPDKSSQDSSTRKPLRYSCPYVGCKRNKKHRKFQPLKTVLCVKNHYRRSHCPKMLTCGKCKVKKFSVVADLKTHEKHCGREKWQCSCGTTFSRKDKLFGHIGLFVGHSPAITYHDDNSSANGTVEGSVPVSGSASVLESSRVM